MSAKFTHADFHPREIELAKLLMSQNIRWNAKVGDWFHAGHSPHVVARTERRDHGTVLFGRDGSVYEERAVVPMLHPADCRRWLIAKGWDIETSPARDGRVTVTATQAETGCKVARTEPTVLTAIYGALIEVSNIIDFPWV